MKRFFDPEGLLWKPLGFIGELVMLSLLWGICSIALVTVGPATAALYDTVVHALRRRDDNLFSRFWNTFRAELKTGCLSALLWLGLLALLFFGWRFLTGLDDPRFGMAAWVYAPVLALLLLGVLCWVFPLLSRFTFGFADLNRTAARLALGNILRSLAAALLTALGIVVCFLYTTPIIFVPGLVVWLWSWLMEPVFARYETES